MLAHGGADQAAQYLAAIVDSSDDAILSVDLGGTITSWNKGAERLLQYTPAEVVGRSIMMLIPQERGEDEPAIIKRISRGERIDQYETIRRRKDGSRIENFAYCFPDQECRQGCSTLYTESVKQQ